jgi:hypothetical protein
LGKLIKGEFLKRRHLSLMGLFLRRYLRTLALFLAVCFACLLTSCITPSKPPTPEITAQALIGEWEVASSGSIFNILSGGNTVKKIIFSSEAEAWLITRENGAYRSSYWINTATEPMHIDLITSGLGAWISTFRFLDANTIKILTRQQLPQQYLGSAQLRGRDLDAKGYNFRRVSRQTKPPQKATILTNTLPSAIEQEDMAKRYLDTLAKAQGYYYINKGVFATSLSDINLGLTEDYISYRFQITLWEGRDMLISAQPIGPGLRSFAAIITPGWASRISTTACRSILPSTRAPSFLKYSSNEPYTCSSDAQPI